MESTEKISKYGWFSQKQKMLFRKPLYFHEPNGKLVFKESSSSIYLTPDNNEVEVTTVSLSPENHGTGFDDIVYVGEVTKYIRNS